MRKALKWAGLVLVGAVLLLLVLGAALYAVGTSRLNRTYEVAPANLTVSPDSASVARGAHLAATLGCQDCHAEDLGGQVMIDAPPFRVVASNLTPAGVGGRYSDGDFERAIRHGVRADGRALLIMPSAAFHGLADEDVAALIAYLRTVSPIENDLPPTEVRPMGRLLMAGPFDPAMEVNAEPSPKTRPEVGPTAAYGAYLHGALCAYCHGADGEGMETPPIPESPPAPPLLAAGQWPLDAFKRALRTGITPGGREMDPEFMPWNLTARMTDEDLEALRAHFATLIEARPSEGR